MLEKLILLRRFTSCVLFNRSGLSSKSSSLISGESGSYCGVLTCSEYPMYIGREIPSFLGNNFPNCIVPFASMPRIVSRDLS